MDSFIWGFGDWFIWGFGRIIFYMNVLVARCKDMDDHGPSQRFLACAAPPTRKKPRVTSSTTTSTEKVEIPLPPFVLVGLPAETPRLSWGDFYIFEVLISLYALPDFP